MRFAKEKNHKRGAWELEPRDPAICILSTAFDSLPRLRDLFEMGRVAREGLGKTIV
jgi:hypothetical protein